MTKSQMTLLFDYDAWATSRQLAVIAQLPGEQYVQDLRSSLGGIQGTLTHIHAAQQLWLSRWMGGAPTSISKTLLDQAGLSDVWGKLHGSLRRFVETLTEERLREPLPYKNLEGRPFAEPLWQQMQHVANHSSYHRGQITTMLRQLGVKPPDTDIIIYYRTL